MKQLLIIIFISFCFYNIIFSQWRTIDTKIIDTLLIDICFPDSMNGWAISSYRIIHTSDGGENWEQQFSPIDTVDLFKISFVNNKIGFIIGYNGLILATKDGGNHWVQQDSGIEEIYLLRDISLIDENNVWIAGLIDNKNKGGILLKTTNGGNSWIKVIERKDGIGYYAVNFLDINNGWTLSSYGFDIFDCTYINRTSDKGKTWKEIGTQNGLLLQLTLTSQDTIWAGGFVYSRSFDGGVNWDKNSFIENFPGDTTITFPIIFVDLLKLNNKDGYAIISRLRNGNEFTPMLYFTNDGGLHWKFENVPTNFTPTAITNSGKSIFISGYNGMMITNKLTSSVKNIQIVNNFFLYQNYPNPFNPTTTIKYEIPALTSLLSPGEKMPEGQVKVILKVYDILGREVATLVNEEKPAGRYETNFNGSNLSGGIYITRLTAGKYNKSIKICLLK